MGAAVLKFLIKYLALPLLEKFLRKDVPVIVEKIKEKKEQKDTAVEHIKIYEDEVLSKPNDTVSQEERLKYGKDILNGTTSKP